MNILQVFQKFTTQKDCIEYLEKTRWGDDPVCPYCGSGRTGRLQKLHHCHACKTSFSVTVGTIFHGTIFPFKSGSWPSLSCSMPEKEYQPCNSQGI